ncbi:hypothetical protein P3G55_11265 [Leptospira sp. 96542]|nr:hypothetical protein [Leptospira sp. 96542]
MRKPKLHFIPIIIIFLLFFLIYKSQSIQSFSDFNLIEWQIHNIRHGIYSLPYEWSIYDSDLSFFFLPDRFFSSHNDQIVSVFPNLYPYFASFIPETEFTIVLRIMHVLLFFGSCFLMAKILKSWDAGFLFFISSILPIYILFVHETIFVLFLQILSIYLLKKDKLAIVSIVFALIVFMRPEMIIPLLFLPNILPSRKEKITLYAYMFFSLLPVFWIQNHINGTYFGLRVEKNLSSFPNWDVIIYLFQKTFLQIPILTLYIVSLIIYFKESEFLKRGIILLSFMLLIIFISPNTGGHNTARYLFGFIPLITMEFFNLWKNKKLIFKNYILFVMFLYLFVSMSEMLKETRKISHYQSNLVSTLKNTEESILVFSNSDLSFASLPLIHTKKLILLRQNFNPKILSLILKKENQKSFLFLSLPPSANYFGDSFSLTDCSKNCNFKLIESKQLDGSLLPIQSLKYSLE